MENDIEYFTVSQVAELTGVTAAQLKNWDKTGLLVAKRTGDGVANNRKLYTQDDIKTVQEILMYRSLDFGLEEIKRLREATPEERTRLVSERANKLKSDYSNIQKQIELTSALEVFTPEALLSELDCDDALSASDEYSKDENLRMMVRWMRSHTEHDAERFRQELAEVLAGFSELDPEAPWEEVQAQLLRFCDVWSKPFGWPTVGQMLIFARVFQEMAEEPDADALELSGLFDVDACNELSEIFYLAWADNGLRVLDDFFVVLYLDKVGLPYLNSVIDFGEGLCALFCELGGRPHLYRGERPPAHPRELNELANRVLSLLEGIILDEELGRYLDIETLFAIDQRSFDIARELIMAITGDELESWYLDKGIRELHKLQDQWLDTLEEYWKLTHFDEIAELTQQAEIMAQEQRNQMASMLPEELLEKYFDSESRSDFILDEIQSHAFWKWLEDHYARVLADPPEHRWMTEEEAVAHEKSMRMLVQEMNAVNKTASDASLEADE